DRGAIMDRPDTRAAASGVRHIERTAEPRAAAVVWTRRAGASVAKAASKKETSKAERDRIFAEARKKQAAADPLSRENLKKLGLRLGLPLVAVWIVVGIWGNLV